MEKQWRFKGALAFGLLGNPCGYKLSELHNSYERWFMGGREETLSKGYVESEEGEAWGKYSLITAVWNVILAVGYGLIA